MVGIKKAWGIALIGAAGPFVTGYVLTLLYFDDQNMAIMSGLTLTATAVSLSMMTLKSMGMSKSKASLGIMTSAVLDDIGSLALVAIIVPVVTSTEAVEAMDIIMIILKVISTPNPLPSSIHFVRVSLLTPDPSSKHLLNSFICRPSFSSFLWSLYANSSSRRGCASIGAAAVRSTSTNMVYDI